jgi:hypothetical protein
LALVRLAQRLTHADAGAPPPILRPLPVPSDLAGAFLRHRIAPLALTLPVEVD